jgi:aminoglycoside phosphotransferase
MDIEYVKKFATEKLGESPSECVVIKSGRVYKLDFALRSVVIKFTPLVWAVDEIFFLEQIQIHNIFSPTIISYGMKDDKTGYLILEFIPDASFEIDDNLRSNDKFWNSLVIGLKQIHSIPVAGFGFNRSTTFGKQNFTSPTFLGCISELFKELKTDLFESPYSELVLALEQKKSNLKDYTQAYLVHSDMGGNNFLWSDIDSKIYFFDAGYLRGMIPTWDIAYFGWRVSADRVTEQDIAKLSSLYFLDTPTDYLEFEIFFLRTLTGLLKIRDGLQKNDVKESHVNATLLNLKRTTAYKD